MENFFTLPSKEELIEIMINVENNPGLKEKFYPVVAKCISGRTMPMSEISRNINDAASTYLSDEGIDEHVGTWLSDIVAKIINKLTKENQPAKNT